MRDLIFTGFKFAPYYVWCCFLLIIIYSIKTVQKRRVLIKALFILPATFLTLNIYLLRMCVFETKHAVFYFLSLVVGIMLKRYIFKIDKILVDEKKELIEIYKEYYSVILFLVLFITNVYFRFELLTKEEVLFINTKFSALGFLLGIYFARVLNYLKKSKVKLKLFHR